MKYNKESANMKKPTAILLAILMAAMLTACAHDNDVSDVPESKTESSVESSEAAESSAEESSEPESKQYVENIADYTVETDKNGELMITKYNGHDPYIIIPSEYEGKPITTVYCTTLLDCDFIKGIKVSEGITCVDKDEVYVENDKIVEFGFCGCTSYEELMLPTTLEVLGNLSHSKKLKKIVVPEGIMLDNYQFFGCTALETVVLPDDLTSIGIKAFVGCDSLKEISLPSKLTCIARGAFYDVPIKEFRLPDTMELCVTGSFPSGAKVYLSEKLANKVLHGEETFLDMLKTECPNIEVVIE